MKATLPTMTYINSNLTNREAYALHGKLDDARMQELLDLEDEHSVLEERLDDTEQGYIGAKDMLAFALKTLSAAYPDLKIRPIVINQIIEELRGN